jgi:glycerophosphoryl diester phosphodiesterase
MCKLSKNFAPNLRTMYLSNNPIYDYIILKQNKIDEIGYNYKVLNQDINIVKMANENGFGVSVWTVDDLEDIKKYSEMKVSAIISDNPINAINILKQK